MIFLLKITIFSNQKAIFGSALNYVQEKEEPTDFLDIFLELESQKEQLEVGNISEKDKEKQKQIKRTFLSPIKSMKKGNDFNSNDQEFPQKLDFQQKLAQKAKLQPLFKRSNRQKDKGINEDPKVFLDQHSFSKHRIQQIAFYQSDQEDCQENEPNPSFPLLLNYTEENNPYSLKNANTMLRDHFSVHISPCQDPLKKWVIKKIVKPKKDISLLKQNGNDNLQENNFVEPYAEEKDIQQNTQEKALFQQLNLDNLQQNMSENTNAPRFINLSNLLTSVSQPAFFKPPKIDYQIKKNNMSNSAKQILSGKHEFSQTTSGPGFFAPKRSLKPLSSGIQFLLTKDRDAGKSNNYQVNNKVQSKSQSNVSSNQKSLSKTDSFNESGNQIKANLHTPQTDFSKYLPIFCLNFNKTLQTRLHLNSLGL